MIAMMQRAEIGMRSCSYWNEGARGMLLCLDVDLTQLEFEFFLSLS
jgi:hypothetical protein